MDFCRFHGLGVDAYDRQTQGRSQEAEVVKQMRLTEEHDGYYSGRHLVLDSSGASGFCDVSRLLPDFDLSILN